MNTLFLASLTLHLIGLVMVAGTAVTEFIMYGQFLRLYQKDAQSGSMVMAPLAVLPRISGMGFGLLLLAGISMLALTHGAFAAQTWFSIKMGVIVIMILNGILVGRKSGLQLRKVMQENTGRHSDEVMKAAQRMRMFQLSQLVLFLAIIVLSAFKFV